MRLRKKIALILAGGSIAGPFRAFVKTAISHDDLHGISITFGRYRNLNAIGEQLDALHLNTSLPEEHPQAQLHRPDNSSRGNVQVAYLSQNSAPAKALANDKFASHRIGSNELPSGNLRRRKKKPTQPFRQLTRVRFPVYGDAEFIDQCPWSEGDWAQGANCTILVKDEKDANGGISSWVSRVVHGFVHAKQAGCKLLVDYGQSVDIGKLLVPNNRLNNWTVTTGFSCKVQDRCYNINTHTISADSAIPFPFQIPDIDGTSLASVPNYRWAYSGDSTGKLYRPMFHDLEQKLPGFQIESGMACSLGTLFHLAPTASDFEPQLFTKILPTLRDKDAFVMTLYIRTGLTDEVATKREKGEVLPFKEINHSKKAGQILDCALTLEARHIDGNASAAMAFSRVVWMVVTDSPGLKQWISDTYGGQEVNASDNERNRTVPREVITTGSRGVHTRPRMNPSTADFADAMIDWYLIGESDVLVAHAHLTFGFTGALRTNRPFFDADGCSEQVMVHDKASE